ncbi:hypothetical protein LCGC14_2815110 [marine sediment metagenome]|uniref:Uncharacterized protein n=1 Tax=marine sediment metagenome TaxID=412755 RepID=A0A0F9BA01_9ZZZZ
MEQQQEKNFTLIIRDTMYLEKRNIYNISLKYPDGDIGFWIDAFKLKYYGGSWNNVFNFIKECNTF